MSHFTTIVTQIKDIEALATACSELNLKLIANTTARGYGNQSIKADFVIRCQGPYDIALQKQADGTYALTTDWWAGHVEKQVGKNYGKLLQAYGVAKATLEARRKGFSLQRTTGKNGAIRLTVNVP